MNFLAPEFTENGFEHINFFYDSKTNLKSIVAIHNTKRGPSLGGCRFYPYANTSEALKDVMRLAEGMTYKAACADLPLGGGKSIIIGDPSKEKNPLLLEAFGRCVNRLGGTYITTVDSGTLSSDMTHVAQHTKHVVGLPNLEGGSGDPSPNTSIGVFEGIKACLEFHYGSPELKGRRIAILGVGNVGYRLAKLLKQGGAHLALADVQTEKLKDICSELDAEMYTTENIIDTPCDVFAPCALGGIINSDTLKRIQAPIIAGAANNQLKDDATAVLISEKGIVYAPDFVINAGGLIHVTLDLNILGEKEVREKTMNIYHTILTILDRSKKTGTTTHDVAIELAKEKIC